MIEIQDSAPSRQPTPDYSRQWFVTLRQYAPKDYYNLQNYLYRTYFPDDNSLEGAIGLANEVRSRLEAYLTELLL